MSSVYQRSDTGAWYCSWREEGRRVKVLCDTQAEADALQLEVDAKLRLMKAGLYELHAAREGHKVAFEDWAAEYLEGLPTSPSPRTVTLYNERVNLHLKPFFGRTPLAHIDQRIVRKFITYREGQDTPPAPATINRDLAMLKLLLRRGQEDGLLHRTPKIPMLQEKPRRKRRPWTAEELRAVMEALGSNQDLKLLARMALQTGIRRTALMEMQWKNIDLVDRTIRVERGKGDKTRVIPLPPDLAKILKRRQAKPRDRVFHWEEFPKKSWRIALEKAGIQGEITFHELRNTYITGMLQRRVDVETVRELVGHRSIVTTQAYLQPSVERARGAAGRKWSHLVPQKKKERKPKNSRRSNS